MTARPENFAGWAPFRFYWQEETPLVDWCYMGEDRFTQPFFENTIARRMNDHFSLLFRHQTPIEFLETLNGTLPNISPTGFIFHTSRCGSTLTAQMLAALPQNIVISEALPIDAVIREERDITIDQRVQWLRWMVGAFGQKRAGEQHYFIKFDSWSTLWLDLVRKAFPEVPMVFLYRDPVEVIVSQMSHPGAQMIRGLIGQLLPGMTLAALLNISDEEYCARVLARFCESLLPLAADPKSILVNYSELPEAVTGRMLKHFGVTYSAEDIAKMRSAAQFNSKTPRMSFAPDGQQKRDEASEIIREMAAKWVGPVYEKLEAVRLEVVRVAAKGDDI